MTTVANVACPVDGSELEGERMMSLCAGHIGYGTDLHTTARAVNPPCAQATVGSKSIGYARRWVR